MIGAIRWTCVKKRGDGRKLIRESLVVGLELNFHSFDIGDRFNITNKTQKQSSRENDDGGELGHCAR
jgi:hypothetical protein